MYDTAKMLNRWFVENGDDLLRCDIDADVGYLLYAPYAAVSSWVPDERYWGIEDHEIPRCGHQGFEEFSKSLQKDGYSFAMFELGPNAAEPHATCRALAIHSAFFMDEASQRKLADHIEQGGRLFISGELPTVDLQWEPCTVLRDAVEAAVKQGRTEVVYQKANFFADGKFADAVAATGVEPSVRYSDDMRAYVHRNGDDCFVFFFNFDVDGEHDKLDRVPGTTRRNEARLEDVRGAANPAGSPRIVRGQRQERGRRHRVGHSHPGRRSGGRATRRLQFLRRVADLKLTTCGQKLSRA